jgi:hypothetical protein
VDLDQPRVNSGARQSDFDYSHWTCGAERAVLNPSNNVSAAIVNAVNPGLNACREAIERKPLASQDRIAAKPNKTICFLTNEHNIVAVRVTSVADAPQDEDMSVTINGWEGR